MNETTDWRARANCRDTDPNDMQPEVATPAEVRTAMALCDGCDVRRECRDLADGQNLGAYGIHAGRWYGEPPRNPALIQCGWCGDDMDPGERGTREYCWATCRKRAQRAREHLEPVSA